MQDKAWLVKSLWSLAAIPAAFAAFVLWNGGVAVGDRAHHVPVLHFMQVFYLLLFTVGCLAAVHLAPDRYPFLRGCLSVNLLLAPKHNSAQHTALYTQERCSTGCSASAVNSQAARDKRSLRPSADLENER